LDHLFPSDLSLPADDRLMPRHLSLLVLCFALGACAVPPAAPKPPARTAPAEPPAAAPAGLGANDALDILARVAALSPEQQRAELARQDDDRPPGPAAQFRLALLLGRDENPAALERGLKLLGQIPADGPRAQTVLDLAKSALKAQLEARRQAARAQELQTRIDQLKALEKSLQQRDDAPKPR